MRNMLTRIGYKTQCVGRSFIPLLVPSLHYLPRLHWLIKIVADTTSGAATARNHTA